MMTEPWGKERVAARLRAIQRLRGYTQTRLGDIMGYTPARMSEVIGGAHLPKASGIYLLREVTGISAEWIAYGFTDGLAPLDPDSREMLLRFEREAQLEIAAELAGEKPRRRGRRPVKNRAD